MVVLELTYMVSQVTSMSSQSWSTCDFASQRIQGLCGFFLFFLKKI